MSKAKAKYSQLAKAVGRETHLKLVWKDWKKERPTSGQDIYVIVKFRDGYMPLTATYLDETFPASEDGTRGSSRWRSVRTSYGELFLENKEDAKRLVAWAVTETMGELLHVCRGS
jgi:hypothetical protein